MAARDIYIRDGKVEIWGTSSADDIGTYDYPGSYISYGSLDIYGRYWGHAGYTAIGGLGNGNLSASFFGNKIQIDTMPFLAKRETTF